eukprot:GHVP01003825.1.p1 GENE.GHVP01003825.1~~GHVP01003825.1.p1  ORF type:complete len:145 (-),score=34.46 GHVP01003825.1:473-907(-)
MEQSRQFRRALLERLEKYPQLGERQDEFQKKIQEQEEAQQFIQNLLETSRLKVKELTSELDLLKGRFAQVKERQSLLKQLEVAFLEQKKTWIVVESLLIEARMNARDLRCQSEQTRELAGLLASGGSANLYSESGGSSDEEMEG